MNITGTDIHYYLYCKRKCWLHINKLNFEQDSENVAIGKAIHENLHNKNCNTEISIDSIKIDRITDMYVIETKKSNADTESARWQLLYYLFVLDSKGVHRKGKLNFVEVKNKNKKTEIIELTQEDKVRIEEIIEKINLLKFEPTPKRANMSNKCSKCSYYDYCFI